jgi:aryl-alcohol dehydrogenase-like predicted oxidoreductase
MALAFTHQQSFVTATIIGATSIRQLEENLAAFSVVLSKELLSEIEKIQERHPNPAP